MLHPHSWHTHTHTHTYSFHTDLIVRSSLIQSLCLVKVIRVTMGQRGWRQRLPSLPFSPLALGSHRALWGSLLVSNRHILKGEQIQFFLQVQILLLPYSPPLLFASIFPLLSVGIFQALASSSVLSEAVVCVCVCVSLKRESQNPQLWLSLLPHDFLLSVLVSQTSACLSSSSSLHLRVCICVCVDIWVIMALSVSHCCIALQLRALSVLLQLDKHLLSLLIVHQFLFLHRRVVHHTSTELAPHAECGYWTFCHFTWSRH